MSDCICGNCGPRVSLSRGQFKRIQTYEEGRLAGLEEAARVAEDWEASVLIPYIGPADLIRALKDRKP